MSEKQNIQDSSEKEIRNNYTGSKRTIIYPKEIIIIDNLKIPQ